MSVFDILKPDPVERQWLRKELLRRAAVHFEQAGAYVEASECWDEFGDPNRSRQCLLWLKHPGDAADRLLETRRFKDALWRYRRWRESLSKTDAVGHARALLGVSACLSRMGTDPSKAAAAYTEARALIADEADRTPLQNGRCWAALGEYGRRVGRADLAQVGYEMALERLAGKNIEECLAIAEAYRTVVADNRLLAAELDARIAGWRPLAENEEEAKGRNRFTNSLGMEFVWIEPGTFMMGSPGCKPKEKDSEIDEAERQPLGTQQGGFDRREPPVEIDIDAISEELLRGIDIDNDDYNFEEYGDDEVYHEVTLTRGYYLQTTPVTQGQWEAVMGSNLSYFKDGGSECPVECVSWNDAREFIEKLNERGKGAYRLPTEAEWEYACRAGSETVYSFGDDAANLNQCAWYRKNSGGMTHPVGQLKPNAWGLYDMHGNVWEWCQDRYDDYSTDPVTDPVGPDKGAHRVIRGGSWGNEADFCRAANRNGYVPGIRFRFIGFRLALRPGQ